MADIISFTQYGLWGDDKIIVPKKHIPTIPDWAQVALNGWRKGWQLWLAFWGIDRVRKVKAFSNGLDSPIAGSVPGYIERQAMRNLCEAAIKLCTAKGVYKLSVIDKTLIALERYYLANFERFEFRATYHAFQKTYLPPNADFQLSHRYLWIADRMGMYRSVASDEEKTHLVRKHPASQAVIDMLEVASARMELLEKKGENYDIQVDISRLLRAQKRKAA